jgi:hypothetical protein
MRESQQIAAEQRGIGAHAHRSGAEQHGKEDHLTGHESSRQSLEHSNPGYLHPHDGHGTHGHEDYEREIAALAYQHWQKRGCPEGSPEQDWFHAVEELRNRH